jgi:hypothetical protein
VPRVDSLTKYTNTMKHTILDETANKVLAAAKEVENAGDRLYNIVTEHYGEESAEAVAAANALADYKQGLAPIVGAVILEAMAYSDGVATK